MNINVYNLENCLFSNVVYLQKCVHFKMQGNKEEWSELNIFLTGLMSQLWAMKSQELPTIVVLNGMYCSIRSCPLFGLSPRVCALFSQRFYLNYAYSPLNRGFHLFSSSYFTIVLVFITGLYKILKWWNWGNFLTNLTTKGNFFILDTFPQKFNLFPLVENHLFPSKNHFLRI